MLSIVIIEGLIYTFNTTTIAKLVFGSSVYVELQNIWKQGETGACRFIVCLIFNLMQVSEGGRKDPSLGKSPESEN